MAEDKHKKAGEWERWNTHDTITVEQEVMGHMLTLSQDPNSQHLGTTVWDASIVLAKYLEKNMRKGEFSRPKMKDKRAIELGSGMGLGGMAFSMLGAHVTLTDTVDVLPLLRKNCDYNLGVGAVTVCELDWYQPEQVAPLQPPFDIVLAADCIYHEHIVEHFHHTVCALINDKSTVIIVNELRSQSVHNCFLEVFTPGFTIRKVPHSKMDALYQHPSIDIYLLKRKKAGPAQQQSGTGEAPEEVAEELAEEAAEALVGVQGCCQAAEISGRSVGSERQLQQLQQPQQHKNPEGNAQAAEQTASCRTCSAESNGISKPGSACNGSSSSFGHPSSSWHATAAATHSMQTCVNSTPLDSCSCMHYAAAADGRHGGVDEVPVAAAMAGFSLGVRQMHAGKESLPSTTH